METKSVVINSNLKTEVTVFNKHTGEVVIRGDVIYGDEIFIGLPIFHLHINLSDEEEAFVDDDYCHHLPYLKPIKAFRDLLATMLQSLFAAEETPRVIKSGLATFLHELNTFSETKSLVRQVKTCVNNLKPEQKDAGTLSRKILQILDRTPNTDICVVITKLDQKAL
jgi:hypothetical protein